MSKNAFDKFIKSEPTGAKKKEMIRQEKRKIKQEARAAGDAARKRKWEERNGIRSQESKPAEKRYEVKKKTGDRPFNTETPYNNRAQKPAPNSRKKEGFEKPRREGDFERKDRTAPDQQKKINTKKSSPAPQPGYVGTREAHETMPLNKFVAHAGICGRREAAELVKQGKVTVNGNIIFEPGFKVSAADKIKANGKVLFLQHNLVYVLLNKPKDYLTTAKDPEGRKTVLDLVKQATQERIYSVGRLDRNTTGVLLLTNDGELAQKLTHPSYEVKKVYEAKLDKPLTKKDFDAILTGVTLEDGVVAADTLAYADSKDKSIIGIEIHSGRNRIVRRIFEHLGYDVKGLDRVMFANLTKKNVDRGKWRMLSEKEVRLLKYMNQSFVRKNKQGDAINDDVEG